MDPSLIPDSKYSVGVGSSVYGAFSNSSYNLPEGVLTKDTLDLNKIYNKTRKQNVFYTAASVDVFHVRVKVKQAFWSFGVTQNFFMYQNIPGDLLRFGIKGNTQFVGKSISLNKLASNYTSYMEMALGYAHEGHKFNWGVRAKLLFGQANVSTNKSKGSIYTGDNASGNRLSADADITINSSYPGYFDNNDVDGLSDQNARNMIINTKNKGLGLDGGLTYKHNSRLTFTGTINDLGFIKWKENPTNSRYSGSYAFNGVNVNDVSNKTTDESTYTVYFDSLQRAFRADTTHKSYVSTLVMKNYLSAGYKIFPNTHIYLNGYLNWFRVLKGAFGLTLQQKIGRVATFSITYTVQNRAYNNIGFAFAVKPGPFQFYVAMDNVTPLLRAGSIRDMSIDVSRLNLYNFNVRAGLNFVWGRTIKEDRLPLYEN